MDKETEKMLEILHENHRKEVAELIQEDKQKELQHKGNKLVNIVLVVIGILVLILLLWLMKLNSKDFIEHCTKAGYSKNYCLVQISR